MYKTCINPIDKGEILKRESYPKKIRKFFRDHLKLNDKYKLLYKVIAVVFFITGSYIVTYPFIPGVLYQLFKDRYIFPYKTDIEDIAGVENKNTDIPEENRVVISKISVDMPIVEGSNEDTLDLGVWHRPGTGKPGVGNMVLTGHRFGYEFLPEDIRTSTSFYNLDKLEIGDYVVIYWGGKEYDYVIEGYEIVDRMDTSIEEQTQEEKLTLYTCHPIGQNDKRLVYYAKPIF